MSTSEPRETMAGYARLRKEFLVENQTFQEFENKMLLDTNRKEDKDENGEKRKADQEDEDKKEKRKKQRGQNKKRRKMMAKEREANSNSLRVCRRFMQTGECEFGDKCFYSHDTEAVLESHQLPGKCHLFETFAECSYGRLCCFRSGHPVGQATSQSEDEKHSIGESIEETNQSQENGTKLPGQSKILATTSNRLSREVLNQLRKHKYDFTRANEIAKKALKNNFEELKKEPRVQFKKLDFVNKKALYLAPLTTVGNLPFRRICKEFGADVTCGEMALCSSLLKGTLSEWALMRRHHTEDVFGVQICGSHVDQMARSVQLIEEQCEVDFIDLNMGCPIDLIFRKGAGSALMEKKTKLEQIIYGVTTVSDLPFTLKMRAGLHERKNIAKNIISVVKSWGSDRIPLVTIHGRSRDARYTKHADWDYIGECAREARDVADNATPVAIYGSGDVLSWQEYEQRLQTSGVDGIMIARGALIKPWIFTEIKERRTWDIRSSERLDILKKYVNYGLEHWGSDRDGVEKTRRFLLEWLSFLYRYIPVGLLEEEPQRINERPPRYTGRDELETLMGSPGCSDWIQISEMLLGKCHESFTFIPKHKANAY